MRNYSLSEEQAEQWLAELDDEQPEFSNPFEDKQGPDGDTSAGAE